MMYSEGKKTRLLGNNLFFFLKIYLFLDRGEGREKERERNINVWLPVARPLLGIWPATQACALSGNQTGDLLVHRPVLNPQNHTSQGNNLNKYHIFVNLQALKWLSFILGHWICLGPYPSYPKYILIIIRRND